MKRNQPDPSDLSRRQFLARSAGLAGASLGFGAVPGASAEEAAAIRAARPVRLGFIGLGDRGLQLLAAALRIPSVRVVGIADPDPNAVRQAGDLARHHAPRTLRDATECATLPDLDAVVIATPVFLHASHALCALAAGLHVYLEKPLALTVDECREVLAAATEAERGGRIIQVGLQRRYSPRYRASMSAIERGEAGPVHFVRAQWHSTGRVARSSKPWCFQREKSGGVVVEQACHQLDIFNWLFRSRPARVCGLGGGSNTRGVPSSDGRDHYGLILEYPRGGHVQLSHLAHSFPDRRFAGVYELVFAERLGIDLANAVAWDRTGKSFPLAAEGGNDTHLSVEGFVRSIQRGEPPLANARVGFDATMTALLARTAIEEKRMVAWEELGAGPPQSPDPPPPPRTRLS